MVSWWLRNDRLLPVLAAASLLVMALRVRLEMGVLDAREGERTGERSDLGWLGRRRAARQARAVGVMDERTMHRMISRPVVLDNTPAYRPRADHDASEQNELVKPIALSRRKLALFLECTAEHSDEYCRDLFEREEKEGKENRTAARTEKKADPQAHWLQKCDKRCQPACLAQCKQRRTDMYEAQLLKETGAGMEKFCTDQCSNLCLQKCQKIAREALVPLS